MRHRLIGILLSAVATNLVAACGGSLSNKATEGGDAGTKDATASPSEGGPPPPCAFTGFAPAAAYSTANEPLSVIAIDPTRSGHLDLVVGGRSASGPTSELFVNDGHGAFTASPYGASGNNVANMVAADFNGDGRVDLASQSNGSEFMDVGTDGGAIGIDLGTATGSFGPQLVTYPTQRTTGHLPAGDFNGDGRPDLAFAGFDYIESGGPGLPAPEPANLLLDVYLNAGDGTFGAPVAYANPDWFQSIATGDFDGDGHLDIAELTSVSEGGFDVFFNAGDGTFRSKVTVVASTGWIAYGLGVADFNGDGKDDVATTTILNPNQQDEAYVLEVFTGAGNGTFDGPAIYPIVDVPSVYQVVPGDFNGDGKPDLAMIIGNSSTTGFLEPTPVSVFENRGDGTFAAPVTYTVGGQPFEYPTAIAAGDFNGDGVTDIAVTTSGEESPYPLAVNVLLSQCE